MIVPRRSDSRIPTREDESFKGSTTKRGLTAGCPARSPVREGRLARKWMDTRGLAPKGHGPYQEKRKRIERARVRGMGGADHPEKRGTSESRASSSTICEERGGFRPLWPGEEGEGPLGGGADAYGRKGVLRPKSPERGWVWRESRKKQRWRYTGGGNSSKKYVSGRAPLKKSSKDHWQGLEGRV